MGTVLVLAILLAVVFLAARSLCRQKKAGGCAGCPGSCGGHCSSCNGSCHPSK